MLADLEVAQLQLRPFGREWTIVEHVKRHPGLSLGNVARELHVRKETVLEAFHASALTMALALGYDQTAGCQHDEG